MAKHNPVTGGEDEEVGYSYTIRFKYRGERIRSIAEQTMKFLKAKYLELNPTDSIEAHQENAECQVLWDLIGYQRQLMIDADEIEAGEVDWKGVRADDADAPFVIDLKDDSEGDE